MFSKKFWPFAGALALSAQSAKAADLFATQYEPAPVVVEQPVEFGTGWYLRGDALWMKEQVPPTALAANPLDLKRNAAEGSIGFGYKFNNWFRADLTGGWGSNIRNQSFSTANNVICPYQLKGLTDQVTTFKVGYLYNVNETCTPKEATSFNQRNLLLNGYLDLGTWSGVTPYVGAGVGVANLRSTYKLDFYRTSDGALYAADLTDTGYPEIWLNQYGDPVNRDGKPLAFGGSAPTIAFAKQNWSRNTTVSRFNFAWSLMAGVAIDLTDHAKLDIGYRYMNLGAPPSGSSYVYANGTPPTPSSASTGTKNLTSQAVKIGIRYMID